MVPIFMLVAIMTTKIIFIFSLLSILAQGQPTGKLAFTKQLVNLKKFDNLKINDSLTLIAELKGYNSRTKTYSQCNILIPQDKWNTIKIETEYIAYNKYISYTTSKLNDTLVINHWYPIMTDTLGAYDNKIVKKEYFLNDFGKVKKIVELKNYTLTNAEFAIWYDNHINKALVLRDVTDLNILFTIINSNLKSNDFFLNNNYQALTKCFNVDYYVIRLLLWKE